MSRAIWVELCTGVRAAWKRLGRAGLAGVAVAATFAFFACFSGTVLAQAPVAVPGTTAVGGQSLPVLVTVKMTASGSGAATIVVTQGAEPTQGTQGNGDFSLVPGTGCDSSATYQVGSQCVVGVVFSPKFPGRRRGAVLVKNGNQLLGSTLLSGSATGSLAVLNPGVINTVAGNGQLLFQADYVLAANTSVYLPQGVIADPTGNLFISDTNNNRMRRVDSQTGIITTICGTGIPGYSGDGGPAVAAQIGAPAGLTMDGAGNIYFADTNNEVIRRIDAVSGAITTVVGTPLKQGYSGDGGPALSATLSSPRGLAFDENGNLYIADTSNNVIRKVDAGTGNISTVAGTGVMGYNGDGVQATAAKLNTPWSVAFGPDGSLYIADLANEVIRKVNAAGVISTVAGNGLRSYSGDGGSATTAGLNDPAAIAFNPAGDLYIADSGNNRVRRVNTAGLISTVAGSGAEQFGGDGAPAPDASLYAPYALYFDQAGNLYISDMLHNRVREVAATPVSLMYPDIKVGKVSAPQVQGLENDGNDVLTVNTIQLNNTQLDSATTTCSVGLPLASDGFCTLGVEFAPQTTGDTVTGSVTVNSKAGNTPTVVNVSGKVLDVNPVTIALTSSLNPSMVGAAVTFTANVSSDDPNISGPVTFLDGTTPICSNIALTANVATCTTSTLTLGQHNITASYAGDNNNEALVSAPLIQTVQQTATVTLGASPNPATVGATVTMTVHVTGATGTPTGTVVFFDGSTALTGNVTLSGGTATFATAQLAPGTHNLTVQYAGDINDAAATSNAVSEVIDQATTTTTLSSSNPSVVVGTSVTVTATVTTSGATSLTGSVAFTEGTNTLGTVNLGAAASGSAIASLTLVNLAPGTHNIVATYSGDKNDATSSSGVLVQTVTQIPTTTALSSDSASPNAGQTVHLTATVSVSGMTAAVGPITGTVTFLDGSANLGTVQVNGNGQATLAVILPAGTQNVSASYAGNTNYAGSTSDILIETVSTTTTTTTLTGSANSSLAGKPITFTAVVSSSTGTPTGTVTFTDGSTTLGVSPLNGGVATFTTSSLSVATHSIVATYTGDSNYVTSKSGPISEVVSLGSTSLSLAGPSKVDVGTTVTLTGALTSNGLTPTGTLTLLDGGAPVGSQNVAASGSYSFSTSALAIGMHTLTVSYAGDSDNAGTVSPAITLIVQQAPTTTSLASSANPSTLGQPVTLTASVTSDGAGITGSISFMDGGTLLGSVALSGGTAVLTTSSLTFGPHSLTAVYSGDTNHSVSTSSAVTEQIVQAATATLISSVNPATAGTNVVFTASLAPVSGFVPTGTVTFHDGANTLGVVTLDGSGNATFATSTLAVASHTISISFAGDKNFSATSATLIQTIRNADTTVALTAGANPATYGTPLSLVAAVTSNGGIATGSITFTESGASLGSALLGGNGVATLTLSTLPPGTHTIIANYAGDGKASASVSGPLTITVLQTTTTVLASNANPSPTLGSIVLTATVKNNVGNPTGTVTFNDGGTQLGTVTLAGGVATLTLPSLSAGSHALTASYAGDGSDFPSNGALTETVQLRPTTTSLSSSQTDASNPQQVTLISVVHYAGPVSATGNITFTNGSTTLGTSAVDSTGVATLTVVLPANTTDQVVASFVGDAVYAGSSSTATAVSGGAATQFTLAISPATMTLQSKQHGTMSLTITSVKNFTDTIEFGCLGQPYASTCTFSNTQVQLAANGTQTVQLTIDTGNPLGGGATSSSSVAGGGRMLLLTLPATLLLGFVMWRNKRSRLPSLLLMAFGLALTFGITGCAGISTSGTPPGTYTFLVTAAGKGTGATQSQTITLNVTQ